MASIIKYLKGTPKQYQAYKDANKIISTYFYFITGHSYNETTKDWTGPIISNLYLGYIELSNGDDLKAAILSLEAKDKEFSDKFSELGVEEGNSVQDLIDDATTAVKQEMQNSLNSVIEDWDNTFELLETDLLELETNVDSNSNKLDVLTKALTWTIFN